MLTAGLIVKLDPTRTTHTPSMMLAGRLAVEVALFQFKATFAEEQGHDPSAGLSVIASTVTAVADVAVTENGNSTTPWSSALQAVVVDAPLVNMILSTGPELSTVPFSTTLHVLCPVQPSISILIVPVAVTGVPFAGAEIDAACTGETIIPKAEIASREAFEMIFILITLPKGTSQVRFKQLHQCMYYAAKLACPKAGRDLCQKPNFTFRP